MNTSRITTTLLAAALAILTLASSALAQAVPATSMRLSDEWHAATEPLKRMPVQDTGFIRTAYTFSGNYLAAISGRREINKADGFDIVLQLLRDPHEARNVQLIKLSHPELVRLYGAARISANQWRDESYRDQLIALITADQEKWTRPLNDIEYRASLIEGIEDEFAIIPREGEWLTPIGAMRSGTLDEADREILANWRKLREALVIDSPSDGATAASALAESVTTAAKARGADVSDVNMDYFYHTHQPFRNSFVLYLFASLFYGAALVLGRSKLNWAGFALLAAGLAEQGIGTVARWILAGRAPVSNMYESMTFAIGGMVLIALVLELTRSTKLVGLGASILGFAFMVLAHKAPIFDSQIRPLMPALQSTWLTYHVITIMLSYSAFALSFFVSGVYLIKSWFLGGDRGTSFIASRLPSLNTLDVFNYRIIGIGFPLLSLGIIFGAIWAATAWGRPWGFDPKETWSAITWLVYAIYLHVRYLAGWTGRLAAIVSVLGFLAVLFTYFGVNYLLPGLHSYV